MMEYDVFISCKSEDFQHARKVYDFLTRHQMNVFFSDVTLGKLADSDYRTRIDEALDKTHHLVVLTSSAKNATSRWVAAEWSFFDNEIRSGRKTGNLILALIGTVTPGELPPGLRYRQAILLEKMGFEPLLDFLPRRAESVPSDSPKLAKSAKGKIFAFAAAAFILLCVYGLAMYLRPILGPNPAASYQPTASGKVDPATSPIALSTTTSKDDPSAVNPQTPVVVVPPAPSSKPDLPDHIAPPPTPLPLAASGTAPDVGLAVRVKVNSQMFDARHPEWERGNAEVGWTGKVVDKNPGNGLCKVAFDYPSGTSGWIAESALEVIIPASK